MKILVTGGTGFIGSHLLEALLKEGHEVTALSRSACFSRPISFAKDSLHLVRGNVADSGLLSELIAGQDVLIHNAAAVGAGESIITGGEFFSSNVGGANSLATVLAAGRHNLKQLILGSSISVYGEGNYSCSICGIVRPKARTASALDQDWNPPCPLCYGPILPEFTPETAAANGEHLYAVTKKYQEEMLSLAARATGLSLTIFRYATVYGAGLKEGNPYLRMLRLMLTGQAAQIFEDGLQTRDFIDVADVVRVNLAAIEHCLPAVNIFNIGSGKPLALLDFINALREKLEQRLDRKLPAPHIRGELNVGDVRHCNIDCSKAAKLLQFNANVSLDQGLNNFVDWYIDKSAAE